MKSVKINGYDDYFVFETGQILSFKNKNKASFLTPVINKSGYCYVTLTHNGKSKSKALHRIVAENLIDNPQNKPQVNHLDGDKENNHVSNLYWCTASENTRHAINTGLYVGVRGEENNLSKLKEYQVIEIRKMAEDGIDKKVISEKFKIHVATVTAIVKRKRWKHVK